MRNKWDVVILGGGFAGLAYAMGFEKLWGADTAKRVLVVSAENYFVYQPFLSEVIGASIEPRHVMNPIRLALSRCMVQRGPQEDVLSETRWTTELLSSPVEAVMKKLAPCLSETTTINEAVLPFGNCSQTLLPIMDAEGKLTSILTKTDIYRAMTHGQDFHESVGTIAKREVAAFLEGQAVREALHVLYLKNVNQAPVLDQESRPVGILSHMDIAEERIRLEHQASGSKHVSSANSLSQNQG